MNPPESILVKGFFKEANFLSWKGLVIVVDLNPVELMVLVILCWKGIADPFGVTAVVDMPHHIHTGIASPSS